MRYGFFMSHGSQKSAGRVGLKIAAALNHAFKTQYGGNQTTLGLAIGVSQSQMSLLLHGERVIDVDQLEGLCAELGIDSVKVFRDAVR